MSFDNLQEQLRVGQENTTEFFIRQFVEILESPSAFNCRDDNLVRKGQCPDVRVHRDGAD